MALPGPSPSLRVLCVDDNADAAHSTATLLGLHGHDTRAETDWLTGLRTAVDFLPQACVLDIRMPGMDGCELATRFRAALGPRVRLIAVTGELAPNIADRARASGFDQVFTKPVEPTELLAALVGTGTDAPC